MPDPPGPCQAAGSAGVAPGGVWLTARTDGGLAISCGTEVVRLAGVIAVAWQSWLRTGAVGAGSVGLRLLWRRPVTCWSGVGPSMLSRGRVTHVRGVETRNPSGNGLGVGIVGRPTRHRGRWSGAW